MAGPLMSNFWAFLILSTIVSRAKTTDVLCPSSCYCDDDGEYVSCVGDGLWKVPMDIPKSAVRLELRNYVIVTLTTKDLEGLIELHELKLQQTQIETIENETFSGLQKLERLELSQNLLVNLTSATFEGIGKLRFLDLSSNLLVIIEEAFVELNSVEQLNLRANCIPQLTSHSFAGLHKVQYLNLDTNKIASIEVGAFQYLTNLAHLILSNNPLTTLSRLDFFGYRLQYIDVSHVGLERVPQSLTKFVRDLRLAKNNLTRIGAGDFDSYPYLGLLVLDDNNITDIENDALGRQEYLMRLWLNGNKLIKIPPNLPPSLRALYMEENLLANIPSYSFKGLINLEQLFLQRNKITELSICAFCDLVGLKSLDLQANQIENLTEGAFANLTQLETLDLSQNNLQIMEARCFMGLDRLKNLQLSRMSTYFTFEELVFDLLKNLQTLEMYDSAEFAHQVVNSTRLLHGLRNLQELNIMHNKLISLRNDFPSFFPHLKVMKMSGNNWHCDQSIMWLTNWIKHSNIQFYHSYSISCATPERLQFKPIMLLEESDFSETPSEVTPIKPMKVQDTINITHTLNITDITSSVLPTFSSVLITESAPSTSPFFMTESEPAEENVPTTVMTNQVEMNESLSTESVTQDILMTSQWSIVHGTSTTTRSVQRDSADIPLALSSSLSSIFVTNPSTEISIFDKKLTTLSNRTPLQTLPSLIPPAMRISTEHTAPQKRVNNQKDILTNQINSSRLKGLMVTPIVHSPHTSLKHQWDQTTAIVVSASLAGGCLLVVLGILTSFILYRCHRRYHTNPNHCQVRRSSSISYCPHRDEVSIVTVSEGTVGLQTSTHHGLGNKLYYVMENGDSLHDPTKDALPDPQLQELLPSSIRENGHVYNEDYHQCSKFYGKGMWS